MTERTARQMLAEDYGLGEYADQLSEEFAGSIRRALARAGLADTSAAAAAIEQWQDRMVPSFLLLGATLVMVERSCAGALREFNMCVARAEREAGLLGDRRLRRAYRCAIRRLAKLARNVTPKEQG